jgi:hypothetical protein
MGVELDRVTKELLQAAERLSELPEDAYSERVELRDHIHALQATLHDLRLGSDAVLGSDEIRAQIRHLEDRISSLAGSHLSSSAAAQTGFGGGIEPGDVHRLNRQIDDSGGIDTMRRELAELRERLSEMADEARRD